MCIQAVRGCGGRRKLHRRDEVLVVLVTPLMLNLCFSFHWSIEVFYIIVGQRDDFL
jgi:hypothetical protein